MYRTRHIAILNEFKLFEMQTIEIILWKKNINKSVSHLLRLARIPAKIQQPMKKYALEYSPEMR